MDSWSSDQLRKMECGGNGAVNSFLKQYGVDKYTDIKDKYNSKAAEVGAAGTQAAVGASGCAGGRGGIWDSQCDCGCRCGLRLAAGHVNRKPAMSLAMGGGPGQPLQGAGRGDACPERP